MKIKKILVSATFVIAFLGLFAGSSSAQASSSWPTPNQPEKPMDKVAVASMIGEFSRDLWDLLGDDEVVDAIIQRWKDRKDLIGKTRSQAVHRLFEEVINEVDDSKKTGKVWLTWETKERNPPKPPVKTPAVAENECSKAKFEQGTIKFYSETRGYGFIVRQDNSELFLHNSAVLGTGDAAKLEEGDRVRFTVVQGPKNLVARCVGKIKK